MEDYIRARSDVFFTGADGSLRSNRAFCQAAGHYACDLFIGSTLQIDLDGNSSTATLGRIAGFGGAPNMGADARGRRHASPAWLKAGARGARRAAAAPPARRAARSWWCRWSRPSASTCSRPSSSGSTPGRWPEQAGMDAAADHDLRRRRHATSSPRKASPTCCCAAATRSASRRSAAWPATRAVGLARDRRAVENLRDRGVIRRPEDLGIDPRDATRNLLAARIMRDLVRASGGLYQPPKRFRNW